ncbi:hypothetical protein B0H10DRAFT_2208790 [Mycena sp. CBHHK59/15]|nr:hypothetical protein B0H10DRAFT_2208790 [Mycena sp. CBHHK59/15]
MMYTLGYAGPHILAAVFQPDPDDNSWCHGPMHFNADELPATFSPNCQLVTPSRKRKLEHMESGDVAETPTNTS